MITARRCPQTVVVWMATLCFAQEALPMMKFASDEVAAAAQGPVAAEAMAALTAGMLFTKFTTATAVLAKVTRAGNMLLPL